RSAVHDIYPLPLHDALPIFDVVLEEDVRQGFDQRPARAKEIVIEADVGIAEIFGHERKPDHAPLRVVLAGEHVREDREGRLPTVDRKSTRLNSSHMKISYAV